MHYQRWKKTGDVGLADSLHDSSRKCSVEGCDQSYSALGYCRRHYLRLKSTGDPLGIKSSANFGEQNGRWKTIPGVVAMHSRIAVVRGKASDHACIGCGELAMEWSYDHSDPDEIIDFDRPYPYPYSLQIDHYDPMCITCHRNRDRKRQ